MTDEVARLALLAITDDLTGLGNRRRLREALELATASAIRQGRPLSVVMLDIDRFKAYNDAHGHQAGDDALRALATILLAEVRPVDLVVRQGGEEFVVALPDADADAGMAVAERMRAAIAAYDWPLQGLTASFGVATLGRDHASPTELIEVADAALYLSKKRGRNRVTHGDLASGMARDLVH